MKFKLPVKISFLFLACSLFAISLSIVGGNLYLKEIGIPVLLMWQRCVFAVVGIGLFILGFISCVDMRESGSNSAGTDFNLPHENQKHLHGQGLILRVGAIAIILIILGLAVLMAYSHFDKKRAEGKLQKAMVTPPTSGKQLVSMSIQSGQASINDPSVIVLLNAAVVKKDYASIDRYIQMGTNINGRDDANYSPLEMAVTANDTEMVVYLIRNGANVNLRKNDNDTPIFLAISGRKSDMVRTLIKNGADITVKQKYSNMTPLSLALAMNAVDLVQVMKEEYSKRPTPSNLNQR